MTQPIGSTPYARRRRRPRWLTLVLVGLVVAPIVEIAVLVAVGRTIGVGWTLLALLLLAGWPAGPVLGAVFGLVRGLPVLALAGMADSAFGMRRRFGGGSGPTPLSRPRP